MEPPNAILELIERTWSLRRLAEVARQPRACKRQRPIAATCPAVSTNQPS